jgi:hypothetical protein
MCGALDFVRSQEHTLHILGTRTGPLLGASSTSHTRQRRRSPGPDALGAPSQRLGRRRSSGGEAKSQLDTALAIARGRESPLPLAIRWPPLRRTQYQTPAALSMLAEIPFRSSHRIKRCDSCSLLEYAGMRARTSPLTAQQTLRSIS